VLVNGAPVKLRFALGSGYPDRPARLSVECDAARWAAARGCGSAPSAPPGATTNRVLLRAARRAEHDALAAALQQCQRQCEGGEVLLLALEALRVSASVACSQPDVPAGRGLRAPAPLPAS
jgi:hypothetical protein